MEITAYVANNRDRAFLVGSYGSYRTLLSRQILHLRRKLGRTTPKNAKQPSKTPITSEDVSKNHGFAYLLLLEAERAWAHAMHMKSVHADDDASTGLTGSTRSHIISRLHKACGYARELVSLLTYKSAVGATTVDSLEAQAYSLYLSGAEEFERRVGHRYEDPEAQKKAWQKCLVNFSEARVIYTALVVSSQKDVYKEFIAGSIDPSIRYAAYQAKLPRTIPVSTVAKRYFRRDQKELVSDVESIDPSALSDDKTTATATAEDGKTSDIPTTITWRGRTVPIADASIGQALAATSIASSRLASFVSAQFSPIDQETLAASYDPILTAAQDTVDAVRRAISDLSKEGIPEADPRMQDLRVSDLAANYSLISWRVGRNRVLASSSSSSPPDDGLYYSPSTKADSKPESKTAQLARLRRRAVLHDATLQSLDALRALPGAARDASFTAQLDAAESYFRALRCLTIAYAHAAQAAHPAALALFARAQDLASSLSEESDDSSEPSDSPTLAISATQRTSLQSHLHSQTARQRGLVALLSPSPEGAAPPPPSPTPPTMPPLSERLHTYPAAPVDPGTIVPYPPTLALAPAKPVFLDLAWNYVDYPSVGGGAAGATAKAAAKAAAGGREARNGPAEGVVQKAKEAVHETVAEGVAAAAAAQGKGKSEEAGRRKGWFGFGRG